MTATHTKEYLQWFDDTKKKSVEEKVLEGAERYLEKHGRPALVCKASRRDIEQLPPPGTHIGSIEVSASQYVQPNHFMLGEE